MRSEGCLACPIGGAGISCATGRFPSSRAVQAGPAIHSARAPLAQVCGRAPFAAQHIPISQLLRAHWRSRRHLATFRRELLLCDSTVLEHHAAHNDFSDWLAHAIHDETLASTARDLEGQSQADGTFEGLRHALVEAIEIRYLA
jgi:hypothetical protein